ncbi:hypothetical protein [Halodesulfovibrio sp.]|jgi:hypothetical protein|uniref:hypothetical protein n=1 Tax=Halodesulfovibrio sp. TaxID=1912772 RepID=UPI0025CDC03F|nr:hypothetical protein [Halodesulfovibrio sp.]MCT4625647.1 hypothetical protein [Halodesulfovibrio sp.]
MNKPNFSKTFSFGWHVSFVFSLAFLAFLASLFIELEIQGIDLSFIPIPSSILRLLSILGLALAGILLIVGRSPIEKPPYYQSLRDCYCAKIIPKEAYNTLIFAIEQDFNILVVGEKNVSTWNFSRLTRESKRMTRVSPDRAIFGDIDSKVSALMMLNAWKPRKPSGLATITASSAKDGLKELEEIITNQSVSKSDTLQNDIVEAVDLVVFITHPDNQPEFSIGEISLITGFDHDTHQYITECLYYEPQQ